MSKKQACVLVSLLFFVLGIARFLFVLDRYPLVNGVDEPLFNQPAISVHDGGSLLWAPAPHAPYENKLWFYHGPFFPRLQTVTFHLFGVSELTSRLPQYIASSIAILILSLTLIYCGLPITGALLPLIWLGDRSSIEVLLARPEGLAFLALALAFAVLALRSKLPLWLVSLLAGFFTALSAGFHPRALLFVFAAFVFLAFDVGIRTFCRSIAWFALGVAVPAVLILWCAVPVGGSLPTIHAALTQINWHAQLGSSANWQHLRVGFTDFHWSCAWVWAIFVATGAMAIAAGFDRRTPHNRMALAGTLFAVCGLIVFLSSLTMFPPYLVYLTVWPVIAVGAYWEFSPGRRGLATALALVLFVSWLPSFGWNAMRAREAWRYHAALSPAHVESTIAAVVPANAPLMVSGDLYLAERTPTRHPLVLRQHSTAADLPCDAWLALTSGTSVPWETYSLSNRNTVVREEPVFPGYPYGPRLTVMTPCRNTGGMQ